MELAASCCAAGTYHPSLSGAEQVKVMNLIQIPDKRLLFKATVPINIQMCLLALGSKSPLKLGNNYRNFSVVLSARGSRRSLRFTVSYFSVY